MKSIKNLSGPEMSHFIKEYGGGSMKKGLTILLKDSADKIKLEDNIKKLKTFGNIKTGIIIGLSAGLILQTLDKVGILSLDKTGEDSNANNIKSDEIEKAIKAVENLSEEEAEELIEQALTEDEQNVVEKEKNDNAKV